MICRDPYNLQQHIAEQETPTLRHNTQYILSRPELPGSQQFLEQQKNRGGPNVPRGVEIGEPAFRGEVETRPRRKFVCLVAEQVRGVVDHHPIDLRRIEHSLFYIA